MSVCVCVYAYKQKKTDYETMRTKKSQVKVTLLKEANLKNDLFVREYFCFTLQD